MDQLIVALMLLAVGAICAGAAWLGRHAGFKAVSLLVLVAVIGFGGGAWLLMP